MGRWRAKEVMAKEEQENERIRPASSAIELQKKRVKGLEEQKFIILLTDGSGGGFGVRDGKRVLKNVLESRV